MAQDLGSNVSSTFATEGYNYTGVTFQKGTPPLDSEFNLLQELLETLTRKSNLISSSGWVSYRKPSAQPGNPNFFYTQDPNGAIPEVAMVNGWPVHVANTKTSYPHTNVVDTSEFPLIAGARVDGVFLEVWKGLVSQEMEGITTPTDYSQIGKLRTTFAITTSLVWAGGEGGQLLKTTNGGVSWFSQPTPTSSTIYCIKFISESVGFLAAGNGSIYKTMDAGITWAKLVVPVPDDIYSLAIVGNNFIIAVGANGTILRSIDGYTFTLILSTNQTTAALNSVYLYDYSIGWACGDNGNYLRTLDGGLTWSRYAITVPDTLNILLEARVSEKLNAISFVNLNDGWIVGDNGMILRTTDGGLRWANISNSIYDTNSSTYLSVTSNLNNIQVIKSYPTRISLSIADPSKVSQVNYYLDPLNITLTYTLLGQSTVTSVTLALNAYTTDEELVAAINAVEMTGGYHVFSAVLSYTESAYLAHDSTGGAGVNQTVDIKFSMGDEAWIVGADGVALQTLNGGARWTIQDVSASFDLYGVHFISSSVGWVVGDQGEINGYVASATPQWDNQDTDLTTKSSHRVYLGGNINSPTNMNLNNNSIQPDVGVETAGRTQVQYSIRVVESVDVANFREAGLGAPYVFSKGPNASVRSAGSYAYTNMGSINGDYGTWRANCRNTVDGYSYAIPMFLFSKRNQNAYSPTTNINGTTIDSLNAVRPDGLTFEDIVSDDIIDIRKSVGLKDLSSLLETSFDSLLSGNLITSAMFNPTRGGQAGGFFTYADDFSTAQLSSMILGGVNSTAIGGITGFAGTAGVVGIQAATGTTQAVFNTLVNKMYDNRPDQYVATYGVNATLAGKTVPGTFSGLGTSQVVFDIDTTSSSYYNEVTYPGLTFVVRGTYVDYSSTGLARVPTVPLEVKNYRSGQPDDSYNFYGINSNTESQYIRKLSTGLPGYSDYVEASSTGFTNDVSMDGSLFRVHIYQEITESTNQIKISKNLEGYFVYAVREIRNVVDGGVYRVAGMVDRDGTDQSTMVINTASTFTIQAGSIIEIIAETTSAQNNDAGIKGLMGQTSSDRGESLDSYRSPYLAVFDKGVKGVNSFYKSVVVELTGVGPAIPLTSLGVNGTVIGLPTMNTMDGLSVPYCWVRPTGGTSFFAQVFTSVSVDSTGNLVTASTAAAARPISASDTVLLMVLVKMTAFDNAITSGALVTYKGTVPQTLQPLPETLDVQVLNCSPFMVLSNIGTGGGYASPFFVDPLTQIPVPDTLSNESFFYNLFGMQFSSFAEYQGYTTLPLRVFRKPSTDVTLSTAGSDSFGRTFYRTSSVNMLFKAEGMSVGNPRKLMVPMLVKVVSPVVSPVLRGEVLLAVATTYLNPEVTNEIQLNSLVGSSVIALYRIPGMPLLKV